MKKLMSSLALAGAALSLVPAQATEYTWNGHESTTWDIWAKNWSVNGGEDCACPAGGDAIFNTSAEPNIWYVVNPKSVLVDIGSDEAVTIVNNYDKPFASTESFVKTGAGTLQLSYGSKKMPFGYNGVWDVRGGTLELAARNGWTAFGTGAIVVAKGATLKSLSCTDLGSPQYGSDITLDLAGTYELNALPGETAQNAVRVLALNGGTIKANGNGATAFNGLFAVMEKVVVTGETAQVFELVNSSWSGRQQLLLTNFRQLEFQVEDVTKSPAVDLTMKGQFMLYPIPGASSSLVGYKKTGSGSMIWPSVSRELPNGDVDIVEGTVYYPNQQGVLPNTDATYTVGEDATLVLPMRNQLAPTDWPAGIYQKPICKVNGGTLRLGGENGQGGEDNYGFTYLFKELYLENAKLDVRLVGVGTGTTMQNGTLMFGSLLSLKGTNAYEFVKTGNSPGAEYHLFAGDTEFRVDDMTGDDRPDATFKVAFRDFVDQRVTSSAKTARSGFSKTGAGTMVLSDCMGTFTGDVDIREGTLLLDKDNYSDSDFGYLSVSYLGTGNADKTITVESGATLAINRLDMLRYWGDGKPAEGGANHFVVKGTLKLGDGALNLFTDLAVENGNIVLGDGYNGTKRGHFGNFAVSREFAVRGTKPVVLAPAEGGTHQGMLMGHTNIVFNVANVTGDGADDLRMELPLIRPQQPTLNSYRWGFTKRGAGTMRLSATSIEGNGTPQGWIYVEEGTLMTDTSAELAWVQSVNVSSGAAVGGPGEIKDLNLAEGAGLGCAYGQTSPLHVKGACVLPRNGFVDIAVPAGTPLETIKVDVIVPKTASDSVTGDVSGWTVRINGQVSPDFHLSFANGRLRAAYNKGMAVIVR